MVDTGATHRIIVQLLSNMSEGKEIRAYLQRFSQVGETQFAVIKIGGAILQDQLAETAAALAFLKTVGLTPIILHGGGPQLDAALAAQNIESPRKDGLRVTTAAVLDVARQVFTKLNIKLVEAIRAQGVEATSLGSDVIEARLLDDDRFGLVGEPINIRLDLLKSVVKAGSIPILSSLGIAAGGQVLNINGDSASRALIAALQPLKIIFLSRVGGLRDQQGKIISSINLTTDYGNLEKADWVHGGMRLKLQEIKRLLDSAPLSSSVSITTPSGLVRELFTHGGAGTLIRLGEGINVHTDKSTMDAARLEALIENAFMRRLENNWWQSFSLSSAVISESYRAGAILTQIDDFTYLDKFAVCEEARGEGLSRAIWNEMLKCHDKFYWRSRTDNKFNIFYHEMATGSVKRGPWTIFWHGDEPLDRVMTIIDRIAARPASFEE